MPNSATHDEIPPSVVGFPDIILNELSDSETNGYSSEMWSLFLRTFADEQEHISQRVQHPPTTTHSCETNKPFQRLSGGPWQSLGGYFDYSQWAARERFVQLDKAIAAIPYQGFDLQKAE